LVGYSLELCIAKKVEEELRSGSVLDAVHYARLKPGASNAQGSPGRTLRLKLIA
jgi:hypothetical protein